MSGSEIKSKIDLDNRFLRSSGELLGIWGGNTVAVRIPHNIFMGPVSLEFPHKLHGLFKIVAGCYVLEFSITNLNEHDIHGTATSLLERGYCCSLDVSVMQIEACADFAHMVTWCAWLGDFEQSRTDAEPLAKRQGIKLDPARCHVFLGPSRRDAEFLERL